ncbi:MAG: hypothetical protein N2643_05245 [Endomicrobia bacterium]|nr:hypothetical protein [Endomicrobiia bacterium]
MKIDINKKWQQAINETRIVRSRYKKLETFKKTIVPYVLISQSLVNKGETVVRRGKVEVSPALIHLPYTGFEFKGFNFEETTHYNEETIKSFLLVRGINLPPLKYNNEQVKLEVVNKSLKEAINHYQKIFQRIEDIDTGLIVSIPDIWQFSLLLYIIHLVKKSADNDLKNYVDLLDE